ncbi:alpha beta hydrolase fold protein [Rutstroemia sp. NJR-2017a BBW]|nr:alpha beta hydrolase fold protein [Rutstroemia sp. NJR-2017a BBW]
MSDPHTPPSTINLLSFGSKIVSAVLARLLSAPIRSSSKNGAPGLYKDVAYTAIRSMLSDLTIAQTRYLHKPTSEIYEEFCKRENEEPKTVVTGDDVKGHWLGREDADVVILFFHGGGYTQPCTIDHLHYLHRLVTDINGDLFTSPGSPSISVLVLSYSLAPEAPFPQQLKEASSMLSYLLQNGKRSPTSIMLAGDSAGGSIALSLLSHLQKPHDGIPELAISEPLRGAVLISPWVSFDTKHDSYVRNAEKDVCVESCLRKWGGMFLGTVEGETIPDVVSGGNNYNEPLLAPPSWWEGMHKLVSNVWIYGGADEIFVDPIRAFAGKFEEGWKAGGGGKEKVVVEITEDCAHIGPILDVMLQYEEKGKTQLGLENWLKEIVLKAP